jgi:hypothetical protein
MSAVDGSRRSYRGVAGLSPADLALKAGSGREFRSPPRLPDAGPATAVVALFSGLEPFESTAWVAALVRRRPTAARSLSATVKEKR